MQGTVAGIPLRPGPKGLASVIDVADADDFFCKHLAPLLLSPDVLLDDLAGEPDGLLARYAAMCRAYARRSVSMEAWWAQEADFWQLLGRLAGGVPQAAAPAGSSEQAVIEAYLGASALLQRLVRVKEWLEATAGPMVAAETRPVPVHSVAGPLDPDSSLPCVAGLEAAYEEAQLQTLWDLLRRGRLQDAIAWCFRVEQPWRAAILAGGLLSATEDGPGARAEWRAATAALLARADVSPGERAVYGCLVGDFAACQPACRDWADGLWSAVVSVLERCIGGRLADEPPAEDAVLAMLADAFATLQARFPTGGPLPGLVQALVLGEDYAAACLGVLAGGPELLRLAAVSTVLVHAFVAPSSAQHHDVVLHAYLAHLLRAQRFRAHSFYCARLCSAELQADAFAGLLEAVDARALSRDAKWQLLREAQAQGVAVQPAIRRHAARSRPAAGLLDWLLFDEAALRPEAYAVAAALVRPLLLAPQVDLAAARQLLPPHAAAHVAAPADSHAASHAKELVYYAHLCLVLGLYEDWSTLYATDPGAERFGPATRRFAEEAVRLLRSDWLADVPPVAGAERREQELARIRARHLTDLTVLLGAILLSAVCQPHLADGLLARFLATLADPELDLWSEYRHAGQADAIRDKLARLQAA